MPLQLMYAGSRILDIQHLFDDYLYQRGALIFT